MDETGWVVAVVDDDPSMRAALDPLLRAAGFRTRIFSSPEELLGVLDGEALDCVVSDVRMPGLSGLELQRELLARDPTLSIVFITGFIDVPMTVQAIKSGAVEFLTKPFDDASILDAISEALRKTQAARIDRDAMAGVVARFETLTKRERDVLECVVRGLANKVTAHELGISEVTVKIHRGHLMAKMQATSTAELVRMIEQMRASGRSASVRI